MKVLVLGATGGVGAHVVQQAVARGHQVSAVARRPFDAPAEVRQLVGDVGDERFVGQAVEGQDAVLSCLGIRRANQANPWSRLVSPPDFTSATARVLVQAMQRAGVKRVVAVSASGVGDSRVGLNLMMRFFISATNVGANYRDLEVMEQVYAASGLDWCCVRPTGLKDGPVTGRVRVIPAFTFNEWISRADVADWMLGQLTLGSFAARTPTISEARA